VCAARRALNGSVAAQLDPLIARVAIGQECAAEVGQECIRTVALATDGEIEHAERHRHAAVKPTFAPSRSAGPAESPLETLRGCGSISGRLRSVGECRAATAASRSCRRCPTVRWQRLAAGSARHGNAFRVAEPSDRKSRPPVPPHPLPPHHAPMCNRHCFPPTCEPTDPCPPVSLPPPSTTALMGAHAK